MVLTAVENGENGDGLRGDRIGGDDALAEGDGSEATPNVISRKTDRRHFAELLTSLNDGVGEVFRDVGRSARGDILVQRNDLGLSLRRE